MNKTDAIPTSEQAPSSNCVVQDSAELLSIALPDRRRSAPVPSAPKPKPFSRNDAEPLSTHHHTNRKRLTTTTAVVVRIRHYLCAFFQNHLGLQKLRQHSVGTF